MASFDKAIPPGGEGKIVLKVDTKGYQGAIYKDAMVDTNDPDLKAVSLLVKAFVKTAVYVDPFYAYLVGPEGQALTKTVTIKAGLDKPLSLELHAFDLEEKVKYTLEEVQKGKEYRILFTNVPGVGPGTSRGTLTLKTNYPERPLVAIQVGIRISKPSPEATPGKSEL